MARKIYKTTKGISLSIRLIIPGRKEKVTVNFKGGVTFPQFKPSYLTLEDVDVQKALEKTSFFNKKFVLVKEFKDDESKVDESKATSTDVAPKVLKQRTVQTAATALIELGADPYTVNTLEDVLAVAKTLNVSFPALEK